MESDSEQYKSNQINILSQKIDYLDNNNDCLTDSFITIYESSLWCIKLVFKLFLQVLLFTKEELYCSQNETINSIDVLSMNNSAGRNYSKKMYRELPRHHTSMIQRDNQRRYRSKINIRSISNQNLNQTESDHTSVPKGSNPSNNLGTMNSHITVVPMNSSHCQNMTSENINLREPLTFINRGMCCGHCRPVFFPNVPFHHSGHYVPSTTPQQVLNQEKESSIQIEDTSETQSTPYSASPNTESHLTGSPANEPLSTDTVTNNEINEENHSVLSFPEHDVSPSQESEDIIVDDSRLKLNAQILVDDSIQTAQEKYQEILRMNADQDLKDRTLATVKQIIKNQPKSALISNKSSIEKLSNDNTLCQELCNKLNLSDANQIVEIIRILASNAPHILKDQPSDKTSLNNNANTNKAGGSVQVLSAVNENSNGNQIINQQQYRLDYSNSAITPAMTLTKDVRLNIDHSKTIAQDDNPIVEINLDLNDETIEGNNEDDENSLPEIFFKRIVTPESTTIPLTDDKNVVLNVCRKNHQRSRHHRSRSYCANKKTINLER